MSVSWRGVFPAITTQFRSDGALDLASTQRCVEEQIRAGVHGLIMLGTVGENCSLEPQEKRQTPGPRIGSRLSGWSMM